MCPINFRWEETYTPTTLPRSRSPHNVLHSPSTLYNYDLHNYEFRPFCSVTSIYMITSVPCRACRPLPDVRGRGAAVDLARHKGKGAVWWHYYITRSDRRSSQVHEQRTAGSRRQASSSGDIAARRLQLCACRARQTARY